jgi:hypothetical protein
MNSILESVSLRFRTLQGIYSATPGRWGKNKFIETSELKPISNSTVLVKLIKSLMMLGHPQPYQQNNMLTLMSASIICLLCSTQTTTKWVADMVCRHIGGIQKFSALAMGKVTAAFCVICPRCLNEQIRGRSWNICIIKRRTWMLWP